MYTTHVPNAVIESTSAATRPAPVIGNCIRLGSFIPTIAIICLLLQTTGCMSDPTGGFVQDQMGDYRNHVWANRAYNLRYGNCDRQYPEHFKQGFVDGYCDVCNGGDGYVPAVAPDDYLGYRFQSPEGAKCVNTWFKSYPLGVKAAREDGAGAFQKVYISKMVQSAIVQEKAEHVLPDDVPVVTPEKEAAGKRPVNPFAPDPSFDAVEVPPRTAGTTGDVNSNN